MHEIWADYDNRIATDGTLSLHRYQQHGGDNLITIDLTGPADGAYTETLTRVPELDGIDGTTPFGDEGHVRSHPDYAATATAQGVIWIDGEAFLLDWDDDAYLAFDPTLLNALGG